MIAELGRLGSTGKLGHLEVVADFLGFRHYTLERFADTMRWVDLAIIGWPGSPTDATVEGIRDVVIELGKRAVVTFGSQSVLAVDGTPGGAAAGQRDRHEPREVGAERAAGRRQAELLGELGLAVASG